MRFNDSPTEQDVAQIRAEKHVPANWAWTWCQNDCGDIVFYDPAAEDAARQQSVPLLVVCSAKCATEYPAKAKAGDPRGKDATWMLMPLDTSHGECSQCGRIHEPADPHDRQSLHYQYAFYAEHDRWPTWADAMAHCSEGVRAQWSLALTQRGVDVDGTQ